MKVKEPQSFAFRNNVTKWNAEHVPLETKIARNHYQAHVNKPIAPYRYQAEVNAGKAQVNVPGDYQFQKKEW